MIALVHRQRIPAIFGGRGFVDIGGLMSYGPNLARAYQHTAVYVHQVLMSAKPANLPVEQPTRFEFVVNLAVAKTLGITIPQQMLALADDIVR